MSLQLLTANLSGGDAATCNHECSVVHVKDNVHINCECGMKFAYNICVLICIVSTRHKLMFEICVCVCACMEGQTKKATNS